MICRPHGITRAYTHIPLPTRFRSSRYTCNSFGLTAPKRSRCFTGWADTPNRTPISDEIVAGRLTVRLHLGFDHKVLDQPFVLDRSGQRFDSGFPMRHLAGIVRGLLELGERHEHLDARHRPETGSAHV